MPDIVSLNGRLLPQSGACVSVADRGFLLGDGLFETIRIRRRAPVVLERHLARLGEGLAFLGFGQPPFPLAPALAEVLAAAQFSEGVARITVTRGPGPRGALPPESPVLTVLITAAPLNPVVSPTRLIVSRATRRNQFSPLSRFKTTSYGDSIIARREADAALADDAILLNTVGNVAETGIANLVLRLDDKWITPPVADGALPGTARARLLEAGLVKERSLTESQLVQAQSGFVVSALTLRPIVAIDSRNLAPPGTDAFVAFSDVLEM